MAEPDFPDLDLLPPDADDFTFNDEADEVEGFDQLADLEDGDEVLPVGRSWAWIVDDQTGNLTMGRRPTEVEGNMAVIQVAQIALRTRRGASPLFPEYFGMDNPDRLFGHIPDDAERRAVYIRDAKECLMTCHERITDVDDFIFLEDPTDAQRLYVDIEIEIDGEEQVTLETVPVGV